MWCVCLHICRKLQRTCSARDMQTAENWLWYGKMITFHMKEHFQVCTVLTGFRYISTNSHLLTQSQLRRKAYCHFIRIPCSRHYTLYQRATPTKYISHQIHLIWEGCTHTWQWECWAITCVWAIYCNVLLTFLCKHVLTMPVWLYIHLGSDMLSWTHMVA